MTDTATIPLWDTLGTVIDAGPNPPTNAAGHAILGDPRYYRGEVQGTPPPGYLILGLTNLVPGGGYMEPGESGMVWTDLWAPTPDDAEKLYRWYHGLVHGVPLVVAGFGTLVGHFRKTGPMPDAQRKAWKVTAILDVEPEDG